MYDKRAYRILSVVNERWHDEDSLNEREINIEKAQLWPSNESCNIIALHTYTGTPHRFKMIVKYYTSYTCMYQCIVAARITITSFASFLSITRLCSANNSRSIRDALFSRNGSQSFICIFHPTTKTIDYRTSMHNCIVLRHLLSDLH